MRQGQHHDEFAAGVESSRLGRATCGDVSFAVVFDLLGRPCGARCMVDLCGWEQRIPSPDLAKWLLGEVQHHSSIHRHQADG